MSDRANLKLNMHTASWAKKLGAVVLAFAYVLTIGLALGQTPTAEAAIPKYINFQGKLTAVSNGSNVANGTYAIQFKLYDAVSGGSLLWTETYDQAPTDPCQKIQVTNGVFNAKLGSCNALTSVDFTGGSLYLTINFAPTGVSYDGEMAPRKQLVSSAYAFVANGVSGDGVINTATSSATALAVAKSGTDYALQVDTSAGSAVTGLKVTSAAAASGLALAVISSGTDENLTMNAKGAGTVSINGTATGDVLLGGGSASTGCTVTNSSGNFACTGNMTVNGGDISLGTGGGNATISYNQNLHLSAPNIFLDASSSLVFPTGVTTTLNGPLVVGNYGASVYYATTLGGPVDIHTVAHVPLSLYYHTDANPKFQITGGGAGSAWTLNWGAGGASATDTTLYRSAASQLRTNSTVIVDGAIGIATTAPDKALEINSAAGNNLRLTYNDSNGSATNYADLLTTASGDLSVVPSGGDVGITGALEVSSVIQGGSATATTYSRLGTGTTGHTLGAADDLLITDDLEVDGDSFFDGNITIAGTCTGCGGGGANTALSNLAAVAINTSLISDTDNTDALGSATIGWSDLFLGSGGVINWDNGNAVLTHSAGVLTVSTGDLRVTTAGTNAASVVTIDGTQTLGNKTLTAARIASGGFLADANGNEQIIFTTTASAVNELTVTNAATAGIVALAATGGDTDVQLNINSKGADSLSLNGTATGDILFGGGFGSTGCTVTNSTGAFACNGAVTGSNLSGTNTGDQTITLTGDVTGSGTGSFATTIGADKVLESHLKSVNAATDEYCLTYEFTTGDFEWQTCGTGSANTSLSNLSSVAINTDLLLGVSDGGALGSATKQWSDLFLAEGGVINWDNGDMTLTQAGDVLTLAGGILALPTSGFSLNGTTVTSTAAQLNYLNAATGTTGTTSTNLVFSTSPTLVTPVLGAATYTTLSGGAITNSALTSGRVTFASTAGLMADDADLTFATDTLTVTKIAATNFTGALTLSDVNMILGTTTGTKFGTATNQKLAFYNSTPIVQPTGDVATALSNLGLVASPTIIATTNANLTGAITSVGNATSLGSFSTAALNTALNDNDVATLAGTETLSGKTLTAPKIVSGGFIADANGNEQIIFTTTASAVNELTLANAATAGIVTLAATGGDTDVQLSIDSKGADSLSLNGTATGDILFGGGFGSTGCTVTNSTGAFACNGALSGSNFSGSSSGTNTGDQTITLTGDVTGSGTGSFATTIGADKILESHLKSVNAATDEYCLTYEFTTGDFEWQVCGASTWNGLSNPTGTQSLTFDDGELNAWTVNSDTETFHTITANSLTTGKVLAISSTSLTTGSLVDLQSNGTAAAASQTGLNIALQGTNGTGGITTYGAQISNTHAGATSTNVALQLTASGGTTANYALLTNGGNVGIGDTTPNSLFTVGSGDLFQVNSTGQIGSQQAPVSDYLFALAGTTGNDNSRIIDITQANDSAEDSIVLNVVNTASRGTISNASPTFKNQYMSLTPTVSLSASSGTRTITETGAEQAVALTNTTLGSTTGSAVDLIANAYGNLINVTVNPTLNDTGEVAGSFVNAYGQQITVSGSPTLTAVPGASITSYGSQILNTTSSAGDDELSYTAYGLQIQNTGNLTTTGSTSHYGAEIIVGGTANTNYGLLVEATGASTNYAILSNIGTNYFRDDLYVGANAETLSNAGFALNGDDVFIADKLGVEGSIYSDTSLIVGASTTYANGSISQSAGEALSVTSGTTAALTLDSGTTGTVNVGTGNNAKTINVGTGTAGNAINIGTNNTTSDTIAIGSALDNVSITGDDWGITSAGVLTVSSCTGCGGGGANTALSNLAAVAINTDLLLGVSDGGALGSATKQWSDLFLAEGGVVNWDNGDMTLTQVGDVLTLAGGILALPTSGFSLNGTTVTSTAAQLNYLNAATGTTGTTSTNLVFSTSPTLVTPVLGAATYTTLNGGAITNSSLTSGRVTFASTAGLMVDDADLTFATDTLTVTKIAATNFTGANTFSANNIFQPTVTTGTGATAGVQIAANSLTTGNGLDVSSTSLSSGSLVNLAVSGTAGISSQKVLNVSTTGVITGTQTTYGGYYANTHSGGTSSNVGLYATASGGTNNYSAIFDAGSVGIGTTTPSSSAKLQVTGATFLNGGLDIGDTAYYDSSVAFSVKSNRTYLFNMYDNSVNPLMSLTQTGKLTIGALTGGSLLNVNGSSSIGSSFYTVAAPSNGLIVQGNTGIGTSAPDRALEVNSATGINLRLTYNDSNGTATNYADLLTTSAGAITIQPSGFIANIGGGTTQTALRFLETSGNGSDYAAFQAPASVTTAYTWTLPATDASGCISSNGSGTLSIASCGGGTFSGEVDDTTNDSLTFTSDDASPPAGTVDSIFRDSTGDMNLNVVSGKTFNVQVAGTDEYNFSNLALVMNGNNITGLGTALTAAAGLTVTATAADLALVTSSSGNITMAPASTGAIQITSGVTTGTGTSAGISLAANSLTTGVGMNLASSTVSSGSLTNIVVTGTAAASNTQKALNVTTSGANATTTQTTYGGYFSNTHTGTLSTNIGLYSTASGGASNNYAAQFDGNILQNQTSSMLVKGSVNNATSLNTAQSVYVQGKYAYIASFAGNRLTVVDISNPASPVIMGSLNDATNLNAASSVFVSGKYAYVTAATGDRLTIVDISNPVSPTLTGTVTDSTTLNGAYSVYVSGKYAYVAAYDGDRLTVVDVSNPASPAVVGNVTSATTLNGATSVYVAGQYAYVAAFDGNRLTVVDISNPAAPSVAGNVNDATNLSAANSVYVSGKYAYVAASGSARLTVVDISAPTAPTVTGNVNDATNLNGAASVYVAGKYAYVAASTGNRLTVVDISNPASPTVTGNVNDGTNLNGATNVFVSGKYAYVAASAGSRLTIVDIAGIDAPTASIGNISSNDITVTENVDVGNNLYVRNGLNVGVGGIQTNGAIALQGTVSGSGANAVAGIMGTYTMNNSTASGFQYGDRMIATITSGTAGTHVGEFIRMIDNTSLNSGQDVRGLEVQAFSGTNVNGTNTGIASYGYTFGLQATTTAQAAAQAAPAAIFADLNNGTDATTKARGNAIRAYTNDATSADMVYLYQETSAYTGNALLMDIGNGSGTFASGNFINLKKAGTTKFQVASTGIAGVNFNGAPTTFGVCHSGADINAATDAVRDLVACNGAPSDLAEWYETVPGVEAGDVVSMTNEMFTYQETQIDPTTGVTLPNKITRTNTKLGKSQHVNDQKIIGVVSTSPFQVMGADIKEQGANPRPIAMVGRVPVKVSDENGYIEPGDFLTSSSVPGVAMRATKSGPVIGQALEGFSGSTGKIMVFVKATTYNGVSIENEIGGLVFDYTDPVQTAQTSQQILDYLSSQLPNLNVNNLSHLNADVIIANGEVVSPNVTARTLRADYISAATQDGGLVVASEVVFNGGLLVDSIGSTGGLLAFNTDVEFFGTPYFTKDTAGFAVVQTGAQTVDVVFDREYLAQPIVNASISFEQDSDQEGLVESERQALRDASVAEAQGYLSDPVSYVITNKSKYGFTIVLNKPAGRDIKLSWTALAVKNASTFMSLETVNDEPLANSDNGDVAGDNDGVPEGESIGDTPPPIIPEPSPEPTPAQIPEPILTE